MRYFFYRCLIIVFFFNSIISFSTNGETIEGIYSVDDAELSLKEEVLQKYYVNDHSSTNDVFTANTGVNFFGCGLTPLSPCKSVNYLLASYSLTGSDTIFVDAGVYEESITIASDVMVIQGAGKNLTEFNGNGLGTAFAFKVDIDGIVINNLKVNHYSNFGAKGAAVIVNNSNVSVELNNLTITNNTATEGGAVYFQGDTLTVNKVSFLSNSSDNKSGGAILMEGQHLLINESTFELNVAKTEGGAIDIATTCKHAQINNSAFTKNASQTTGGAMQIGALLTEINTTELSENMATSDGGAIKIEINKRVVINNTTINDNTSNDDGGGIYTSSGVDLFVTNGAVIGGIGVGNKASKRGGGIFFGGDSLLISSSIVSYNEQAVAGTSIQGAGIYQQGGKVIITDQSSIKENITTGNGGGIFTSGGDLVVIKTSSIEHNKANKGGGVYFNADSIVVNESFIRNNISLHNADAGGGFYIQNGKVIISKSAILSNTASSGFGGGLFLANSATLELYNDSLASNNANFGGAIYFEAAEMKAVNIAVRNNTSTDDGGGIYFKGNKLTMTHSRLRANITSGGEAGALYADVSDSAYLFKNSVIKNQAINSGAMAFSGKAVVIDSNYFQGNKVNATSTSHAGGAFRSYAIDLKVSHSVFDGNSVTGHTAADGGVMRLGNTSKFYQCIFRNNVAPDDGAVVLTAGSNYAYFENCLFNNNTAGDDGVIKAIGSSNVELQYVTIADNVSQNSSAAGLVAETMAKIIVHNSIIYGNTAKDAEKNSTIIDVSNSVIGSGNYNDLTSNLMGNPNFVSSSTNDYSLLPTSSAIGLANTAFNPGVDIYDVVRGTNVDAGAFEFNGCDTLLVTKVTDLGVCGDLRFALTYAINKPGRDTVKFDLSAMGNPRIQPLSALPIITGSNGDETVVLGDVNMDGTPDIELNGSSAGIVNGLEIRSKNVVIQGLVINEFKGDGIAIKGVMADSCLVLSNYIGLNRTGAVAMGNLGRGIYSDDCKYTRIGNGTTKGRNVVSGNNAQGIELDDGNYSRIYGNYIGTDVTGLIDLGNVDRGIWCRPGADSIYIGDVVPGYANVISGNNSWGIGANGNKLLIKGNYIGVGSDGVSPMPNSGGVVMGGSTEGNFIVSNVIASNQGVGLEVNNNRFDNRFHFNILRGNGGTQIVVGSGAQRGVLAPLITAVVKEGTDTLVKGSSTKNALIQLYFDSSNEGKFYYDTTQADANGNWSKVISLVGVPTAYTNVLALQDTMNNTSSFSIPKPLIVVCDTSSRVAGTITWTGAVSNDWFECGNWDAYELPNTKLKVVIPNVARKPKIVTQKAYCESLQIDVDNGADLTIDVDSGAKLQFGN